MLQGVHADSALLPDGNDALDWLADELLTTCRFIAGSSPGSSPGILMTAFPPKPLTDDSQTLEEAGLLNSVVMQR